MLQTEMRRKSEGKAQNYVTETSPSRTNGNGLGSSNKKEKRSRKRSTSLIVDSGKKRWRHVLILNEAVTAPTIFISQLTQCR